MEQYSPHLHEHRNVLQHERSGVPKPMRVRAQDQLLLQHNALEVSLLRLRLVHLRLRL